MVLVVLFQSESRMSLMSDFFVYIPQFYLPCLIACVNNDKKQTNHPTNWPRKSRKR